MPEFKPLFLIKNFTTIPCMNSLKRFHEFFRFHKDILLQSSKIVFLRSQRLLRHAILALGKPPFSDF